MKLVNLKLKDIALKATWPQILASEQDYAKLVYSTINSQLGEDIWNVHLRPEDVKLLGIGNKFWEDVVSSWCTYNYWNRSTELDNMMIWYNSRLKINGKPFLWPRSYNQGLKYVYQLFNRGFMENQQTLAQRYNISVMQYNSLVSCIPKQWVVYFQQLSLSDYLPNTPTNYQYYKDKGGLSKTIYNSLNGDITLLHNKAMKWNQVLGTSWSMTELGKLHESIKSFSNHVKMRDFQYRLLQNALVTNCMLFKWKLIESDLCTFCQNYRETTLHILFECPLVKVMWDLFVEYVNKMFNKRIIVNGEVIVTNNFYSPKTHVVNTLGLILKQFIYVKRCLKEKLYFTQFTQYVAKIRAIEKYIAVKNQNLRLYYKKWSSFDTSEGVSDIDQYIAQYMQQI